MSYQIGERYIGSGESEGEIVLHITPGNALGAYLDGARITVHANAQDATGDTMNDGEITVFGNTGDATGYAMRGGKIFVRGDAGYRLGIHIKQYHEKMPKIIVGGRCGSFLGEYQAGGVILVLGLGSEDRVPVGRFCGTGMHGGRIYLRTEHLPTDLPAQVVAETASQEDMQEIGSLVKEYCERFGNSPEDILSSRFYVLKANSNNPYRQFYVHN